MAAQLTRQVFWTKGRSQRHVLMWGFLTEQIGAPVAKCHQHSHYSSHVCMRHKSECWGEGLVIPLNLVESWEHLSSFWLNAEPVWFRELCFKLVIRQEGNFIISISGIPVIQSHPSIHPSTRRFYSDYSAYSTSHEKLPLKSLFWNQVRE